MRAISRIPAIVLLVVLAVLPLQAWLSTGRADVRITRPLDGFDSVVWAATLRADGALSVSITYDLGKDASSSASIRLPNGARFARADGVPVAAEIGKYAEVDPGAVLTVTYERVGAVTRYDDGVVIDLAGIAGDTTDSDQALFTCPRCYIDVDGYGNAPVYGALFADDLTDASIAFNGIDQLKTGESDGAIRFVGMLPGVDTAGLVARLPLAAAPDAPTVDTIDPISPTASNAVGAYDAIREAAAAADEPTKTAATGAPIGRIATALILSGLWVVLVVWILLRIASAKRALNSDQPVEPATRDAAFTPPSTLEPALVGVVVGSTGRGDRSIVAATLLNLAHRGVIRIEGLSSERYTLTVPPGARGSTPTEEAVLAELRPQGQLTSTATFSGPPLWGADAPAVARRIAKVVAKEAHKARLVRMTLAATVLVPASVAMGIVALIGTKGDSGLAWAVTFGGPVLAVIATLLTGSNLTARGRAERRMWLDYGSWLRKNSQLAEVGAPGIATWGEPLIYAAAVGAAPKAAQALSVDQ